MKKVAAGIAAGVLGASAVMLFGAAPANAKPDTVASCTSGDFCAWDATNWGGSPFLQTSDHTNDSRILVPQNITSSGYNSRLSGYPYCGFNEGPFFDTEVASWGPSVSLSLSGSANNVIDYFLYYSGC